MIKKTFKFVLPDQKFKILGASRTDAMVSAVEGAFELFLDDKPLPDFKDFMTEFNRNLPPDIRAVGIREVDEKFNVIQHPKTKEYLYLFSFGEKNHPFAAPLLATFLDDLDIGLMKEGAKLFEGEHYFGNYCTKPTVKTVLDRSVDRSEIVENNEIRASFFPSHSYIFRVTGSGFLRNQIRLMMGALVQLGRGELSLKDLQQSLQKNVAMPMTYIAPGSGLILNKVDFQL